MTPYSASSTGTQQATCELSIVIKALNEAHNIARTLEAALTACTGLDAEVILADSLSADATVEIASKYPVTVVQLVHGAERCCGIGAQLGYQYARGRLLLIIDGDMELDRDWLLAAMRHLDAHPHLAGVGGVVCDMNLSNIEFKARQLRKHRSTQPGEVDRLYGGGLYRRSAIEQAGYFTHRALHACEELELGLRLSAAGWRLARLDMVSIRHYGHTVPMWALVARRWQSYYVDGAGELLRASLFKPWFWRAVACQALPIAVIGWWGSLVLLAAASWMDPRWFAGLILVGCLPMATMVVRKRSFAIGLYSVLAWCIDTAGLLRGLARRQAAPTSLIEGRVLHRGGHSLAAISAFASTSTRPHIDQDHELRAGTQNGCDGPAKPRNNRKT